MECQEGKEYVLQGGASGFVYGRILRLCLRQDVAGGMEPGEVADWLLDDASVERILRKTPCLLGRATDYEQMSLF